MADPPRASGSSSSSSSAALSGTLNGSGSTFQLTFQQAAAQSFKSIQPNVTVNYGGGGSGKGRTDLAAGTVQYAGSDSPIPSDEASSFKGKPPVLYFPVIIGPITMAYNLSGVSSLKLTPTVIADIFQAKITKWNDPAIAKDQPRGQAAQHGDHYRPPLGLLGHHRELLLVPAGLGAQRVEARHQFDHQLAL